MQLITRTLLSQLFYSLCSLLHTFPTSLSLFQFLPPETCDQTGAVCSHDAAPSTASTVQNNEKSRFVRTLSFPASIPALYPSQTEMLLTSLTVFSDTIEESASTSHVESVITVLRDLWLKISLFRIKTRNAIHFPSLLQGYLNTFKSNGNHDLDRLSPSRCLLLRPPRHALLASECSFCFTCQ